MLSFGFGIEIGIGLLTAFLLREREAPALQALIVLVVIIAPVAWKGFNNVQNGFDRWTWSALGLIVLTLQTEVRHNPRHHGQLADVDPCPFSNFLPRLR